MKRYSSHKRAGFTLLEVLIATSVIMVGIFGIASAIALCEQLFKTSFRADMAADCGRAALKTMLAEDFLKDFDTTAGGGTFTPVLKTCNWTVGTSANMNLTTNQKDAADFKCKDHMRQNNNGIDLEQNPPNYDTSLTGDYAWVGTVHQVSSEYCEVSAAVAFKPERTGTQCGCVSIGVSSISDSMGVVRAQISGGANADDLERLVVGQYVFLWTSAGGHWYRIGSLYNNQLELYGPQWTSTTSSGNIYTPGGVVSAYTQIVPIQNR